MAKIMIPVLNFSAAKTFLEIIGNGISNPDISKNFFAHSVNPLLNMCLIYELLMLITKKFFSLNTLCRAHMNRIIETCIVYIDQVDDENFLTQLMLEKDYSNRDSLRIATDLELLEIIQSPKVEAIILRIYNSDFD